MSWLEAATVVAPASRTGGTGDVAAHVVELVVAGLLALGGVRSLLRWLVADLGPVRPSERLVAAFYATARVGMWFAFAGFFAGYALVENPAQFRWYVFVPLVLAGVQLLSGLYLGRSPLPAPAAEGVGASGDGKAGGMDAERPPGPLEPDKRGATSEPGRPQPEAAEVESARLLANQARETLSADGLPEREIRRLADDFVAEDRGEDLGDFIA